MAEKLLAHILPNNATIYERTLASQVQQILSLDANAIRTLWDPMTCDIALLPYLAWALSVDLWKSEWDEQRKRSVVAASFANHKIKGTKAGIEAYLGQVDCVLRKAVVPPARAYATTSITDAQRRAYIAALPQIRIYPYLTKRTAPKGVAFFAKPQSIRSFFAKASVGNDSFMQASAGPKLIGRQATFYDKGVEVPAAYEVLSDITSATPPERVMIASKDAKQAFFGSAFFGSAYMEPTVAGSNVITVQMDTAAAQQYAVFSGLDVINVNPIQVFQQRTAPIGCSFLGDVKRQTFMGASYGPRLIYDQIAIMDPSVPLPSARARFFYGYSRFGIAPFTAELTVQVDMIRPKSVLGTFYSGFMQRTPMTKLNDALRAIECAKSLRDTVYVNTEIYRTVTLKDAKPLGSFSLGELISVV